VALWAERGRDETPTGTLYRLILRALGRQGRCIRSQSGGAGRDLCLSAYGPSDPARVALPTRSCSAPKVVHWGDAFLTDGERLPHC
jgi:hypothetical protein